MFYDTSSTYREAYGKFFRSGTLLPDGLSSVPFFVFVLFVLFVFYFWLVFFSLVPDCTTTQRKFFLRSSINFFAAQSTVFFFFVATTVFFLFFSCTHSGKVKQASLVLRRRPSHQKDGDTREALPATLASPKFSWSSSAIWTIFTSSRMISSDHPGLSGPNARAIGWQLVLDFLFLLRKRRRSREGDGDESEPNLPKPKLLLPNAGRSYRHCLSIEKTPKRQRSGKLTMSSRLAGWSSRLC